MTIPGRRTRRALLEACYPTATAWIRSSMRLSVAGAFLFIGHGDIAKIVTVLAFMNVASAVEGQIANVLFAAVKTGRKFISDRVYG